VQGGRAGWGQRLERRVRGRRRRRLFPRPGFSSPYSGGQRQAEREQQQNAAPPLKRQGPPEKVTYSTGTSTPAAVISPARPKMPLRPGNIHSPESDNSSKKTA
jgi:hypothetical protein